MRLVSDKVNTLVTARGKLRMQGEPASEDGSADIEEVLHALGDSRTLDLLGMTNDRLQAARNDSELFETLKVTYEFLVLLRDNGVLGTFLSLPKDAQANFIRWVRAMDAANLRHALAEAIIWALRESPLADSTKSRRFSREGCR